MEIEFLHKWLNDLCWPPFSLIQEEEENSLLNVIWCELTIEQP